MEVTRPVSHLLHFRQLIRVVREREIVMTRADDERDDENCQRDQPLL